MLPRPTLWGDVGLVYTLAAGRWPLAPPTESLAPTRGPGSRLSVRSAATSPVSLLLGRSRPKTSTRGGWGTVRPTMGHGAVWDRRAVGEGGAAGRSAAGVCLVTPRHQCECECGNFRRWKRRRGVVGPIHYAGLVRHVSGWNGRPRGSICV